MTNTDTACTIQISFPLTYGSDGRQRPVRTYAEGACSLGGWGWVPAERLGRRVACKG